MLLALLAATLGSVERVGPARTRELRVPARVQAEPRAEVTAPYDLAALRIFNRTLMRVNDAYVDPTRVEPRKMLLAALDQVQTVCAEVLIEHPSDDQVAVVVDTARQTFAIGDVDSPWALSSRARAIFRFIGEHLPKDVDAEAVRNLEYAATNGLLSTLDPHSMLLDPDTYSEMQQHTRGQYGGIGVVVGLRRGELTVLKLSPGMPAARAGLRAGDRITRIGDQSTANMRLSDAAGRLTGEPDTAVELWVRRGSEGAARKLTLRRGIIATMTVASKRLGNGIGLVKLYGSFAGNSDAELRRAMDGLKSKELKGLILDLRGNPGGLVDQALKIADEFVDSGTLMTTVGYANKRREEKRASAEGSQPRVPMAVLVDHGSASASEIVAGALKNLDRAVIIGTRTFGKGSMQVVFDNDDGSALKLTIAQYLTPGDVSIQSVGITPDIALERMLIDRDRGVALFHDFKGTKESDLDAHLQSRYARAAAVPFQTLRYLVRTPLKAKVARDEDDAEDGDDDLGDDSDGIVEDYETDFARDLLAGASGWKRSDVLRSSGAFLERARRAEQARVATALAALGVDWAPLADDAPASTLVGALSVDRAQVGPGEKVTLTGRVTNRGQVVAGQVRARLKTSDDYFDGRELVFGRIAPGETRSFAVPVTLPRDVLRRSDRIELELHDQRGSMTEVAGDGIVVEIAGTERPAFALATQLVDEAGGNGDGLLQRGESLQLHALVRNAGAGAAGRALVELRNLSGDGVRVNKGRFVVGALAPGETRSVDFTVAVESGFAGAAATFELVAYDSVLHESAVEKVTLPVVAPTAGAAATGMARVVGARAAILAGAAASAPVVGSAEVGATFAISGSYGAYWRVDLGGRPGFVAKASVGVDAARVAAAQAAWTPTWSLSPPRLELQPSAAVVDAPVLRLLGAAHDEQRVADMVVFVSNRAAKVDRRKVFYRSNRGAALPTLQTLSADVPLWPGTNVVTVVARQSATVLSSKTIVVERTEPRVAQKHGAPDWPNRPGRL